MVTWQPDLHKARSQLKKLYDFFLSSPRKKGTCKICTEASIDIFIDLCTCRNIDLVTLKSTVLWLPQNYTAGTKYEWVGRKTESRAMDYNDL